jgi:uncharacterized SAM-binding protein YcdF (DUF218 family)
MTNALFGLRKFLPTLLMPFSLSLLLIAVGLLRRRRVLSLAGLLLLFLASLPAVSDSLGLLLENQYPRLQPAQCPTADVVVALSGFAGANQRFPGEIRWYYSVGRFEGAVRLFRMQKAPILLFTDSQAPPEDRHNPMAELVRQAAIDHGIPASAIRFTRPVTTTADEAEAVRDYLRQNGGRRVILVTSALHMSRAALLFQRAAIDFVPFPVDYQSDGWEWRWERFVPSPTALGQTEQALHEIYGSILYRILPFAGPHAPEPK